MVNDIRRPDDQKQKNLKKQRPEQSLSASFLRMTVLPLIFLTIIVTMVAAHVFTIALQKEIRKELRDTAGYLEISFDQMYPGDYHVKGSESPILYKGNHILSGQYMLIDALKKRTDQEMTLFYQNIRVMTTITGSDGKRIVGTGAHPIIVQDVIRGKHDAFYTNVEIRGQLYYAFYQPLYNSDGSLFGMIGVAKPRTDVQVTVYAVLVPIILIALFSLFTVAYISTRYSRNILGALRKTELFLEEVAKGNLSISLDQSVYGRKDEIGKMGRAAAEMEHSLQELVEKDVMTGLYNRRYGNQKLSELWHRASFSGMKYCIAIGDIDFFKEINDTYGHECGDQVLKNIAQIFMSSMPANSTVIRWGGEEFLFVFERMEKDKAVGYLNEILQKIRDAEFQYNEKKVKVTITIGIVGKEQSESMDEMVSHADERLYRGKQNGRNQIVT